MAELFPRILIVAEHVSLNMGGEAARPLHYFRVMRKRGVEVWMLVHARTREEIKSLVSPEDFARFTFIPDTRLHKILWHIGKHFPHQVRITTFGAVSHLWTQILQKRLAKRLVIEHKIDVVHEPIPISPKQPSVMYDVGAPVVIGPLNGDINYPPAFAHMEKPMVRASVKLSRWLSAVMNKLLPGKLRAHTILVSNDRTRAALPKGTTARVVTLVANAVDMATWAAKPARTDTGPARFTFLGRLVDFKMVDVLLEAFKPVTQQYGATLDIIGDGAERPRLEEIARDLGIADRVTFSGWLNPADSAKRLAGADVLVFPSLRECGGAVVMEAMAVGLPVIAADWGGPADYVGDDGAGILIKPKSRESFRADLIAEMNRLASSPELIADMSRRARQRAVNVFDWEARVDRLLEVYQSLIEGTTGLDGSPQGSVNE